MNMIYICMCMRELYVTINHTYKPHICVILMTMRMDYMDKTYLGPSSKQKNILLSTPAWMMSFRFICWRDMASHGANGFANYTRDH